MSDFRSRPKDQYIEEANWQELYILCKHWKADLSFYKDDLKFLHHLIDKYFMWISKKEHIDMVRKIEVNLLATNEHCTSILNRINEHLSHLAALIDNSFATNSLKFRMEHALLDDDITTFVRNFRTNRKEIFTVTDYLMDTEKLVKQVVEG